MWEVWPLRSLVPSQCDECDSDSAMNSLTSNPQTASLFCISLLFNDGHVLHLRSETIAVRRRMRNDLDDYDGQMVSRGKCGLNFLTLSFSWRKTPWKKNLNQKNWSVQDLNPGLMDEKQWCYTSTIAVVKVIHDINKMGFWNKYVFNKYTW